MSHSGCSAMNMSKILHFFCNRSKTESHFIYGLNSAIAMGSIQTSLNDPRVERLAESEDEITFLVLGRFN